MSGDDRRSRRRSGSRSKSRDRDRHRGRPWRSRSPSRHDRYRPRSRTRSRSRSRSRGRHRDTWERRDRGHRDRERSPGGRGQPDLQNRYQSTFTSGGRVFEDNGGLPSLTDGQRSSSGRLSQYAAALSTGLDASLDQQPYGEGGHSSRRQPPSNVLCVRGLPEDAEEADLYKLFEPVPGVVAVRVVRDRHTQMCRGFAYLELSSPEAAAALMDSDWREQTYFGEHRLRFSYDVAGARLGGGGAEWGGAPAVGGGLAAGGLHGERPSDWVCEHCQAVNFGRRYECYQCSSARTANAQRISIEPDAPSYILRAGGLEPQTTEETLHYLFTPVVPVKEIRLVRDKYTGAPRGFAFLHFFSVADAARAMQALQNSPVEGQESTLKLSYAKDRYGQLAPGTSNQLADSMDPLVQQQQQDVGEAFSGWEPKAFDDEGAQGAGDAYGSWEPKAFADYESGEAAGLQQQQGQPDAGAGSAGEGRGYQQYGGQHQQQYNSEAHWQPQGYDDQYAAGDPAAASYAAAPQGPTQAAAYPGYAGAQPAAGPATATAADGHATSTAQGGSQAAAGALLWTPSSGPEAMAEHPTSAHGPSGWQPQGLAAQAGDAGSIEGQGMAEGDDWQGPNSGAAAPDSLAGIPGGGEYPGAGLLGGGDAGEGAYREGVAYPSAYAGGEEAPGEGSRAAAGGEAGAQFSSACYEPDPPGYNPYDGGFGAAGGGGAPGEQQAGFEYDAATGYMKDPVSGYLYDANTGLYFHPQLQQWGNYDHATQQFVPYEDPSLAAAGSHAMHAAAQPGMSTAAESALAMTNAALYMSKVQPPPQHAQRRTLPHPQLQQAPYAATRQPQQQPQPAHPQQPQQPRAAAAQKRKGAVIGAAPQLDPQGLLEAARAAEEKAQLLKKLKEQQQRAAAAAAQQRQRGQVSAPAGAGGKAGPQQQQQRMPGFGGGHPTQAPQGAPGALAAPAPSAGGVQGVIHRGKWARKG